MCHRSHPWLTVVPGWVPKSNPRGGKERRGANRRKEGSSKEPVPCGSPRRQMRERVCLGRPVARRKVAAALVRSTPFDAPACSNQLPTRSSRPIGSRPGRGVYSLALCAVRRRRGANWLHPSCAALFSRLSLPGDRRPAWCCNRLSRASRARRRGQKQERNRSTEARWETLHARETRISECAQERGWRR